MMSEILMDRHYARLAELSQIKDGWNFGKGTVPNSSVFLDAMYVVSLCYIHNVKIKGIYLHDRNISINFDREDGLSFYLHEGKEHGKGFPGVFCYFPFKREELKDIFLDTFLPMPKKKIG